MDFFSGQGEQEAWGRVIALPLLFVAMWLFFLPFPASLCAWVAIAAVPLTLLLMGRMALGWNPLAHTPLDPAPALLILCMMMTLRALTGFNVFNPSRFWLSWLPATALAVPVGCLLLGRKSRFLMFCVCLYTPLPVLQFNATGAGRVQVRQGTVVAREIHASRHGNSYSMIVRDGPVRHEFELSRSGYAAVSPGMQVCFAQRAGRLGIVTGELRDCAGRSPR